MKIKFTNAGKRFNREWIFRNASLEFNASSSYAITGPNGSGKSTMLQCMAGMLQLSEGMVEYTPSPSGPVITPEETYGHISFCAPYLDLVEEMTLIEFLDFHSHFKSWLPGLSTHQIIGATGLTAARNKQIRYFSSGMKQRVKLAQAIFSGTPIVLLDEPCSNLDANGIAWYHSLIHDYCPGRLVVVCSNDAVEYEFCKEIVSILDYKSDFLKISADSRSTN